MANQSLRPPAWQRHAVAWLSVDLNNIMLTVSQEDINFETNFLIDKPLSIDQTLYVYAN